MRTIYEQKVGRTGVALGWSSRIMGLTRVLGGILFFALLHNPVQALSATWYVDSSVATSGNGTSWANAWTNIYSISGVKPGDIVYISGGPTGQTRSYTTPTSAWNIASGSAANPVVYQIGQDSQHNGTALFNGSGSDQDTWLYAGNCTGVTISGDAGDGKMHFALTNWTSIASANNATALTLSYINFGYIPSGVDFNPGDGVQIDHCWCYINSTTADHFSYLNGNNSTTSPWGRNKAFCNTIYVPHIYGSSGGGLGADCFQWNNTGIDIYSNLVVGYSTNYTGGQHQDGLQPLGGSYFRVHDNVFMDIANYPLFGDGYYTSFNYCQMYNNIACFSDASLEATAPPQAGGWGVDGGYIGPIPVPMTNCIVCNNLAVDYVGHTTWAFSGSGQGNFYTNCWMANNLSVNGGGLGPVENQVIIADNVLNITASQASNIFVRYVPFGGTNNDFHLTANATALIGQGTNMSQFFATDKDGNLRPASGAWDIGPYQYASGVISNSIPVIQVAPGSVSYGTVLSGTSKTNSITVKNVGGGTLSGAASVRAPFSIVTGGSYNLGSNQSQTVTMVFSPNVASNYTQSVTFTGGGGTNATVSGSATTTFPAVQLGITPTRQFVLTVTGHGRLHV